MHNHSPVVSDAPGEIDQVFTVDVISDYLIDNYDFYRFTVGYIQPLQLSSELLVITNNHVRRHCMSHPASNQTRRDHPVSLIDWSLLNCHCRRRHHRELVIGLFAASTDHRQIIGIF